MEIASYDDYPPSNPDAPECANSLKKEFDRLRGLVSGHLERDSKSPPFGIVNVTVPRNPSLRRETRTTGYIFNTSDFPFVRELVSAVCFTTSCFRSALAQTVSETDFKMDRGSGSAPRLDGTRDSTSPSLECSRDAEVVVLLTKKFTNEEIETEERDRWGQNQLDDNKKKTRATAFSAQMTQALQLYLRFLAVVAKYCGPK